LVTTPSMGCAESHPDNDAFKSKGPDRHRAIRPECNGESVVQIQLKAALHPVTGYHLHIVAAGNSRCTDAINGYCARLARNTTGRPENALRSSGTGVPSGSSAYSVIPRFPWPINDYLNENSLIILVGCTYDGVPHFPFVPFSRTSESSGTPDIVLFDVPIEPQTSSVRGRSSN